MGPLYFFARSFFRQPGNRRRPPLGFGFYPMILVVVLVSCQTKAPENPAASHPVEEAILTGLFSTTLAQPILAAFDGKFPPYPGTNVLTFVLGSSNKSGFVHGLCFTEALGGDGLPVLAGQISEVEPFRLRGAQWIELSLPGRGPLMALRLAIQLSSDSNRSDRGHYRLYGWNPNQPRMPLLFDGYWASNRSPEGQFPEEGVVQVVQDWRTEIGSDPVVGGWTRNLETLSPETEQSAFEPNGQYRHFSPEGGLTLGLWARHGEAIGLWVLLGAKNFDAPRLPTSPSGVRQRLVFDGARAVWARWSGDAPAPEGSYVRVPTAPP